MVREQTSNSFQGKSAPASECFSHPTSSSDERGVDSERNSSPEQSYAPGGVDSAVPNDLNDCSSDSMPSTAQHSDVALTSSDDHVSSAEALSAFTNGSEFRQLGMLQVDAPNLALLHPDLCGVPFPGARSTTAETLVGLCDSVTKHHAAQSALDGLLKNLKNKVFPAGNSMIGSLAEVQRAIRNTRLDQMASIVYFGVLVLGVTLPSSSVLPLK